MSTVILRPRRPFALGALGVLFITAAAGGAAQAQTPPEDWAIIASNGDAALGIDRNAVERDGDLATASVLMGKFRPETFDGGAIVSFYISREAFDCRARTRAEQTVLSFGPTGVLNGPVRAMQEPFRIQPLSLADHVLIAVCGPSPGADKPGFDRPLDAIAHERDERISQQRPVND